MKHNQPVHEHRTTVINARPLLIYIYIYTLEVNNVKNCDDQYVTSIS